jgi:hypothetical protein
MKIKTPPLKEVFNPVQEILDRLDFAPENVIAAAAENPRLFMKAVDHRLDQMHSRSEAEMDLEQSEARADLHIRDEARKLGEKITEKAIEQLLTTENTLIEKRRKLALKQEQEEYSKLLVEACRMRRDCLEIVAGLVRSEVSMARAIEESKAILENNKKSLRAKYPGSTE